MMMKTAIPPRFGQVLTRPIGPMSTSWKLTISGEDDLQTFKPLRDKYGTPAPPFGNPAPQPDSFCLTLTNDPGDSGKNPYAGLESPPMRLHLQTTNSADVISPETEDIGALFALIEKAEGDPLYYKGGKDRFGEVVEKMHYGLFNTVVHMLKLKAGGLSQATQLINQSLR